MLPRDEGVAKGEILGKPHHGVVNGGVAVRVVFADDVADDAGAFLWCRRRIELQKPHRPEQAAVHRFQPVADVGKRARGDGGEGVDQIAFGQGGVEGGFEDGGVRLVAHAAL